MKEIWSGFLRAIGAFAATSMITLLGIWLFPVRWLRGWFGGHGTSGGVELTIFLVVLSTVLLGLLIWSRISYSRFRMRVYKKKVTDDELRPEMWKDAVREAITSREKLHPRLGFLDSILNWLMRH